MLEGFSDEKIVTLLESHSLWGWKACREIIRRKEVFIPRLLEIVKYASENIEEVLYEYKDSFFPAALLLAQFQAAEAHPLLVKLLDVDDNTVEELWGDLLTDSYDMILRDTYDGDPSPLQHLIEDRAASEWSRVMAIKTYAMLYQNKQIDREEELRFFRHLIYEVYTGKPDKQGVTVLSYIADCVRENQFSEMIEDVKTIYDRDGIDEMLCGEFDEYVKDFSDPVYGPDNRQFNGLGDLEKWNWFKPHTENDEEDDYDENDFEPGESKIGRNEPCPCGNGKKYKHCCGR